MIGSRLRVVALSLFLASCADAGDGMASSEEAAPRASGAPGGSAEAVSGSGVQMTPSSMGNTVPVTLPITTVVAPKHPLAGLPTKDLDRLIVTEPRRLGPASIGRPNRGGLWNGLQLPADPRWILSDPSRGWGTAITIAEIQRSILSVNQQFPNTPPLYIGDLSREQGGWLRPHRSHQSGRDVDVGYYYRSGSAWYVAATRENLDVERTWALLQALVAGGAVEYVFMDFSVQIFLKEYAMSIGVDPQWLDDLFGTPTRKDPLVRHARGHRTHLHVRFSDPEAEETGQRIYPRLVRLRRMR